jgi:Reverse transcriptase (RNA-dependent DNA polymerase)
MASYANTTTLRVSMSIVPKDILNLATLNVACFGDTDIFPFPVEDHIFHDLPGRIVEVLAEIDGDFAGAVAKIPILNSRNLSVVGYSGFRWGTQIDPIWNAYLLALVLTIASEIEVKRVPADVVFSYRYKPDQSSGSLFDKNVGWLGFQKSAIEHAKKRQYVLRCDISDFYPRIYHHRLENALKKATGNAEIVRRIMLILTAVSDGVSYGLPVGGPAARILSELLLNRIDRLLLSESISYCRFVDDFVIFSDSREGAYSALIELSGLLLSNEGLSLQKAKTRVMTSKEFIATSEFSEETDQESTDESEERAFKRLRVHYDPYSPSAEADYAALLEELKKFDIVGMLGRELAKSKIDEGLTRRLISAIKHLAPTIQSDAVRSMLKSLDLLYPIFPSVMVLCRGVLDALSNDVKNEIFEVLRNLISDNSYITQVPTNLSFALRVLAEDSSEETEILLAKLYKQPLSIMLKRDIILMMAHRGADHWISNCRKSYATVSGWERRALLVSSYILADEGSHWRDSVKKELNGFDRLVLEWAANSKQKQPTTWRVPL